jgi:hypothetical protein
MTDSSSEILGIIVGSVVGLGIAAFILPKLPFIRDKKQLKAYAREQLFTDIKSQGPMTLLQMLANAGVRDTFLNRGSLIVEVGKLCIAKRLIEETPPNCPSKELMVRRTYRLP